MKQKIIILGCGGHAGVLYEILTQYYKDTAEVLGFTSPDEELPVFSATESNPQVNQFPLPHLNPSDGLRRLWPDLPRLGTDEAVLAYPSDRIRLVNGIGSVGKPEIRKNIFERFKALRYTFAPVIHPSAVIAPSAALGEGIQIMAGAILQTGAFLGSNTLLNTRASVDHDCHIGRHVHLAPGVTLSGGVTVDDSVHIGTGATVIQSITIGSNCTIGAGSLVIQNVPPNTKVYGIPAKEV